ncbi:starch synthase 3, chloroplastic/amyloplastic-like [Panicum hallii]|nr:starch synthase 3, chloroplastic/amyloplastic-like [Panicum hallii]
MEMMLQPQSLICSLSDQVVVIRPAFVGNGPAQALLRTSRCARSRLIRCPVASSDRPNRKSRRMVYPKIKVNAFRGYAPKVTIQTSTKKSEHHDCDEETIGTYNRQLGWTDVVESTSGTGGETAKEDLLHNASSYPVFREIEEVRLDLFEAELPGNALIDISLGELEVVDEAEVEEDKFEVDFSGIALSSAAVWELDSKDEANDKEDIFVVDLSRIASDSAAVGEVVDEAEAIHETFNVDSSGSASSSGTYGDVDEVGEPPSTSMEDNAIDSPENSKSVHQRHNLVFDIDKEEGLTIDSCVKDQPVEDYHKQGGNVAYFDKQKQLTYGFREQDLSIVQFPGQNHAIFGFPKQDISFLEQKQAIVGSYKQDQTIVSLHEQDRSFDGSHCQDESIVGVPEPIQCIVGYNKSDQSIVGSYRGDKSIVGGSKKIQSTVGYYESDESNIVSHKQDDSITGVPVQIQSIIDYSTSDQSIDDLPKQHQSIVHIPEQKQCIVGFHIQDLPIVGNSKESQTMQHAIVRTHDALLNKEEHFEMIEEQKSIKVDEEQWIATKERISVNAAEFLLLLSKKESSWAEDGVRITEDEEQYKVDETSMFAEQDIQDLPHDNVDPQALQRTLQELAHKNYSLGSKLFAFPEALKADSTIDLYFNRDLSTLANEPDILIKGAFNGWKWRFFTEKLHMSELGGDWWCCKLYIPKQAYRLDFVFFNGRTVYENDGNNDFMIQIESTMDEHLFEGFLAEEKQRELERLAIEEAERMRQAEEQRRRAEERAEDEADMAQAKAERRAKLKAEMKKKTMKMFLVSQKHIVYTEPLEIHAGTTVDVLYNPSNTVLTGKPEVWFQCSFNRWMHPGGVLPPQKMVKAGNGAHLKATVNVPRDAFMMDFVFSELEGDGIYDNRNGLDYHIPVFGSVAKEPPMHIVHIAVEMAPIAKVGGLADVVTSLSRAVQDLGHNVEVILPKHDCLNLSNVKNLHVHQSFSFGGSEIKVWRGLVEDLCVYFLEPKNGIFGVGCVYGRNDDRRFGFFCHSALEFLLQSGSSPHILHCHDWSSAPVAWLYKENYAQSSLANAGVVFTIHNLEFGAHYIGKAMRYCDKATTVSNSYSREVSGHGAIAPHLGKFYGILNGIDPDIWDPYSDNFIPVHYTSENVVEGKSAAKKALQQKLGLQEIDVPIVGIVTRLTAQKGIHLIKHAIHRTLEWNGQVVLLGAAPDPRIQGDFVNFANVLHGVNNGRVRLCLTYDEPLSHLIYAGSDFILVPSMFEPCGLTQLVAMRYGAIPIVRKTGGLHDTVFDVDTDKERARARGLEPNGFSFDGADSRGVDYALNRAISAWFDARSWFHSLCKRVMEQDWSWNRPALDYIELYHSASKF